MEMYEKEKVMACDWFSDLFTNNKLPSAAQVKKWNDENWFDTFAVRQAYVERFSFPLITKEVISEITAAINDHFIHVGGAFLKYLNFVVVLHI